MLQSARLKLPPIDYVSVIASLYKDKRAILLGTLASALAAFVSAWSAQSLVLFIHGLLFMLTAALRYREAILFHRAGIAVDDAEAAEHWETRAFVMGSFAAINYGLWCFSAIVLVADPFAELAAVSVTIAAMVGIVARNFGLDRLILTQSILLGLPLCLALVLKGDIYHMFLASLFAPMMASFRSVARDVREILINAVHDRVAVTKLVNELDTTLDMITHGVCMLDADWRIAVANPQFVRMVLGDSARNVVGGDFRELIRRAENYGVLSRLAAERLVTTLASGDEARLQLQMSNHAQCEVTISHRDGQMALVIEDVSERIEAENRIRFMARYDGLTGLPNRAYFTEQVNTITETGDAHDLIALQSMLMVIDIDDFKHINDSLGHLVGDQLLQQVADRIRLNLDSDVLVGRFGGDEFIVFDHTGLDEESAEMSAHRLIEVLGEPFQIGDESLLVRFSLGYVLCGQCEGQLEDMLKRADLALYSAKAKGKGQYCAFHEDMDRDYHHRQMLKKALKSALETGQLSLAYQPIVDITKGRICGCEALARWTHPEFGNVPPSVFIPIAEEIGMISDLTEWVLLTAARECVGWTGDIFVSVNISARDIQSHRVEEMIDVALSASGLPPHRLEVEVTESALIEEREHASATLLKLADRGISIALDDFGTGYSSLAYVHDMPFNKLKIDRTFTSDVTHDPKALKLMRSIAHMSKELDMKVTVEGVETEEQLAVVNGLGLVDQIQGYLFGAPVPQSEIAKLVRTMRITTPLEKTGETGESTAVEGVKRSHA